MSSVMYHTGIIRDDKYVTEVTTEIRLVRSCLLKDSR